MYLCMCPRRREKCGPLEAGILGSCEQPSGGDGT